MTPDPRRQSWLPWGLALLLLVGLGAGVAAFVALGRLDRAAPSSDPSDVASIPTPSSADQAEPAPRRITQDEGPRVWAVVIGIDAYEIHHDNDFSIPLCHGAEADAQAVADWFRQNAGWGDEHVLLLLQPTRAELERAVGSWLAERAGPDDIAVFYFAGQAIGLPPPETNPNGPGREFLLPFDARPANFEQTGWVIDEALDPIAARGTSLVCWLDTSLLGRGQPIVDVSEFRPDATRMLQKLTRWPGATAWLASERQPAVEAERVGERSRFTGALLRGLGTPQRPNNLLACLDALNHDPELSVQGFRAMGGISPALNLWSGQALRRAGESQELLLQRGHANPVNSIAFTADGARMVTSGNDSTIKLWRVEDRALLRSLSYHTLGVEALALRPDGRYLASGDHAGWTRLWDLREHREINLGPPLDAGVSKLAFLPEGDRLVTHNNNMVWLWSLDGQTPPRRVSEAATALACASRPGEVAFAVSEIDGKVHLFDPEGNASRIVDGPGGTVNTHRIALDGRHLVLAGGERNRRLLVLDLEQADAPIFEHAFEDAIERVQLFPDGSLVVGLGSSARLFRLADGAFEAEQTFALPHPLRQFDISQGGRHLAACTVRGALRAWSRDEDGTYQPLELPRAPDDPLATSLAFAPDGRTLAVGDQAGGVRFWTVPVGQRLEGLLPRRGQIDALDISEDGRFLLQITHDRHAQVWDLQEGRTLTHYEGSWNQGVISPDGSRVFLLDEAGRIVPLERQNGRRLPIRFEPPDNEPGVASFDVLAASKDPEGRYLAAASWQGAFACVWEARTGRLVALLEGHQAPDRINAVAFAPDPERLLTAGEDGKLLVWDLSKQDPTPEPFEVFEGAPMTSACFDPIIPGRVAIGTLDGRVLLWQAGDPEPLEVLGTFEGQTAVRALTFSRDGAWLVAAGGLDKNLRVWSLTDRPEPVRLLNTRNQPAPNHEEMINALVAWPNAPLIASAGNDTTTRLWQLEDRQLLGTLTAEQGTSQWVVYTPDGLFDSSIGGEAQITWRIGDEVLSLEQFEAFEDRCRVFQLADQLRKGNRPDPPPPTTEPPPRVAVDPPLEPVASDRQLELTISLGEPGLEDIRFYQNGIPIALDPDLVLDDESNRLTVPVRLRPGWNRFHAMATRPGSKAIDGRSNVVEIRYDGEESGGRVHVVALGVSTYRKAERALQFADRDAETLADFLHEHGVNPGDERGLRRVLTNEQINERAVDQVFQELRDAVQGRPEDTVVVFLAGHTDVLANRYYLLLSNFSFPDRIRPFEMETENILAYASIYRNLARLHALQRLVIIDACQAEAIEDDPVVRRIAALIDNGAHQAKTAYLLAARRGEAAGEAIEIEHGLLTYTLLRGMGHPRLKDVPDPSIFEGLPNADLDANQRITTDELRWFTENTLPRLAASFPLLVQRAGINPVLSPSAIPVSTTQSLRFQGTDAAFPIVELPNPPEGLATDRE